VKKTRIFVAILLVATLFLLVGCGSKGEEVKSEIQRYEFMPGAFLDLINGNLDAVVGDSPVVLEYIKNNPEADLHAFGDDAFEKEYYGIAMRKEDTELHELVNAGLANIKNNGIYDKIFNKYFGDGEDYAVPESDNRLNVTYVVASDMAFAPFESVNEAGEPEGFDMDLIRAIAADQGFAVKLENTAWDGILPALIAGNCDMVISAMTITEERKQSVAFSDPYFEATQYIVVKEGSDIKSLDDILTGKKIGVQIGTTGDIAITKLIEGK